MLLLRFTHYIAHTCLVSLLVDIFGQRLSWRWTYQGRGTRFLDRLIRSKSIRALGRDMSWLYSLLLWSGLPVVILPVKRHFLRLPNGPFRFLPDDSDGWCNWIMCPIWTYSSLLLASAFDNKWLIARSSGP